MNYLLLMLQGEGIEPTPRIRCENFPPACITDISSLSNIALPFVYMTAALVLLGVLIYAALDYIRSQGDPTRLKKARQTITWAVLGIIIVFCAYFLVRVIAYILDIPFML